MAFTGKPYAVNGGPVTGPILRRLAAGAFNGGSGVMRYDHLAVTQTPSASGNVLISTGTAVMGSRYPGKVDLETYLDTNEQAFEYPIAPTGAAPRTDYLVVRVEDPDFPGQNPPADRLEGPYTRVETLSADPRVSPPSYPFALIAKVSLPANTVNVTQAMIDSGPGVREIADPRIQPIVLAWNGRSDGNADVRKYELISKDNHTMYWPPEAVSDRFFKWEVPVWAGQLNMQYTFGSVFNNRYDCWGFAGIRMVDTTNPSNWINLPLIDFDLTTDSPGQWSRDTWTGGGRITIPTWARGNTVTFRPIGSKVGGQQDAAKIYLGAGASISMNGIFMESAIHNIL